ncbi:hypothetical protein U3516DRAFT_765623 [Neocallimastix sp. 'constans']
MKFKIITYLLLLCLICKLVYGDEKNIYCNAQKHNDLFFDHYNIHIRSNTNNGRKSGLYNCEYNTINLLRCEIDIPWALDNYVLFNINAREGSTYHNTLLHDSDCSHKVPNLIVYQRRNGGNVERAEGGKIIDLRRNQSLSHY